MTKGRRQGKVLLEQREAPGYGNLATTACRFPSGEPSASPAISSVFICLSACVLLYLLMCLSQPSAGARLLKSDSSNLSPGGRACMLSGRRASARLSGSRSKSRAKEQNSSLGCTVLYSLHFSVPRMCLIISYLVLEGVQGTRPMFVPCSDTAGGGGGGSHQPSLFTAKETEV